MKKPVSAKALSARSFGKLSKQDESFINNKYLYDIYGAPAGVMKPADRLPLTAECKHYSSYDEMPESLQKYVASIIPCITAQTTLNETDERNRYWYQRNTLWQYDDYDIRMTDAAWFGVTPEPIAV